MPLLRYFTYVGGALIALLFLGSYLFPETPMTPHQDAARPIIRVSSDRVGPPRVDLDTTGHAAAAAPALALRAQSSSPVRLGEAQLLSPAPTPAAPAFAPAAPAKSEPKVDPKGEIKKTKIAKRPERPIAGYPHIAAYPPFYQPFRWTW